MFWNYLITTGIVNIPVVLFVLCFFLHFLMYFGLYKLLPIPLISKNFARAYGRACVSRLFNDKLVNVTTRMNSRSAATGQLEIKSIKFYAYNFFFFLSFQTWKLFEVEELTGVGQWLQFKIQVKHYQFARGSSAK